MHHIKAVFKFLCLNHSLDHAKGRKLNLKAGSLKYPSQTKKYILINKNEDRLPEVWAPWNTSIWILEVLKESRRVKPEKLYSTKGKLENFPIWRKIWIPKYKRLIGPQNKKKQVKILTANITLKLLKSAILRECWNLWECQATFKETIRWIDFPTVYRQEGLE